MHVPTVDVLCITYLFGSLLKELGDEFFYDVWHVTSCNLQKWEQEGIYLQGDKSDLILRKGVPFTYQFTESSILF